MSAIGRSGFGKAAAGVPDSGMKSCAETDTVNVAAKKAEIVIDIRPRNNSMGRFPTKDLIFGRDTVSPLIRFRENRSNVWSRNLRAEQRNRWCNDAYESTVGTIDWRSAGRPRRASNLAQR